MRAQATSGWTDLARGRGGFVLPMAVFVLLVLVVLGLSAFFIGSQEALMTAADKNGELAFYLSERGAMDTFSDWDGDTFGALNAFDTVTVVDTLEEGRYFVHVTRTSGNMYVLDVESYVTEGGLLWQGASRRLGWVARAIAPNLTPPHAAWITMDEVEVDALGMVSGTDMVPTSLAGVCEPADGTVEYGVISSDTSAITEKALGVITGDPAKYQSINVSPTTFAQFGGLSWDDLVGMATHTLSQGSYDAAPDTTSEGRCEGSTTTNWGNPTNPTGGCGLYFPIIHVTGNLNLKKESVAQGILLVDGKLTVKKDAAFYGLVIVQGELKLEEGADIYGAVMSENEDTKKQEIKKDATVQYSSCALTRAIAYSTGGFGYPLDSRSWVDLTMAQY